MDNKDIVSIGYSAGNILDMLEFCVRDLTSSVITCTKGCDTVRVSTKVAYPLDVISFSGDFDNNFYSLTTFSFEYYLLN